ncbi:hypothetical protein HaLaN_19164 [Haematococcus lacustris]|uniref:Uncharacterized protein n=1 Tax=Haematococcus lacustris TaxID=44745 RepID=A0A699ZSR7_HAELA|nr:hypothetical protein HaLaN_19164 [Haematococcus lacustris]
MGRANFNDFAKRNPDKECSDSIKEDCERFKPYAKLRTDHGPNFVPEGWGPKHARGLALLKQSGRAPVQPSSAAATPCQHNNAAEVPGLPASPSMAPYVVQMLSTRTAELATAHGELESTVSSVVTRVLQEKLPKLEAFMNTFMSELLQEALQALKAQTSADE